ncbi:hypothetical protein CEV33_3365, partial [Brucella grignonensis]
LFALIYAALSERSIDGIEPQTNERKQRTYGRRSIQRMYHFSRSTFALD